MFSSLLTFILTFVITYVLLGYLVQILEIYELGLQEYKKNKKNIIIKEIKNDLKNESKTESMSVEEVVK